MRNLLEPVTRAVFSLVSLALSVSVLSNNGVSPTGVQAQQYLLGLGEQPLATAASLPVLGIRPETS